MKLKTDQVGNLQRSLGQRIRELRHKQGWTQEQFAQFCGLHRTYMGHVERGEKNVSLSTVARVAEALGVRIPALFGAPVGAAAERHPKPHAPGANEKHPLRRPEIKLLLDELQAQRKALRQALRDLSGLLAGFSEAIS